jgi:pimeloyl-ACP methyl ester carboxylesterase
MYPTNAKDCKLVILLHGQCSRKEEFLEDMINYVDAGYLCVCIDLVGHGERISSEPIMSLEITSQTGKDLNTLISYYSNKDYADIDNFGIVGLSQGGSVAYWYTAYGYYTPSVIVVGSTTPDYTYFMDDTCIQNGKRTESIWDSTQIADFINKNNPINQLDKLSSIPTMSGNSLDDTIVSYKGSEAFEKVLKDNNNTDSIFYYFDGVGHNVTEDFVQKIIPYIKKWL